MIHVQVQQQTRRLPWTRVLLGALLPPLVVTLTLTFGIQALVMSVDRAHRLARVELVIAFTAGVCFTALAVVLFTLARRWMMRGA